MGLFGKKIEIKKEHFVSCFEMDKNSIAALRRNQGFNVTTYTDGGAFNILAEMKSFMGSYKIINKISIYGGVACEFTFYETLTINEVLSFLQQYFQIVPRDVKFKSADGGNKLYNSPAFYLSDGNVLIYETIESTRWFRLRVISKDSIIK